MARNRPDDTGPSDPSEVGLWDRAPSCDQAIGGAGRGWAGVVEGPGFGEGAFCAVEAPKISGHDRTELEQILHGCVSRTGLSDAYVSMTCTRGRMAVGSRDLRTARHCFYCFAIPFVWINSPEKQAQGGSLWISSIPRIPPESVDSQVKNYHWLDLDRAPLDAYDHGADLVVLRDASGAITEGPGDNVFAYWGGVSHTPSHGVLAGITRRSVIELVEEDGTRIEQGPLSAEQLRDASEVLVTSTAGDVMPVTTTRRGRPSAVRRAPGVISEVPCGTVGSVLDQPLAHTGS